MFRILLKIAVYIKQAPILQRPHFAKIAKWGPDKFKTGLPFEDLSIFNYLSFARKIILC